MKRLSLFIGTIPLGAKLQTLAVAVILGWYAWIDYTFGIWPVTIGIVVFAFLLGRLLLPVMMAHQKATFRIWSAFGITFLTMFVLAQNQWWWRTMLAHFGREFFMWLDLSCGYWFISEVRLQQMKAVEEMEMAIEQSESTAQKAADDNSHHNYYAEKFDTHR